TLVLPEDKEEIALTLDGKKKKLKIENFINLGKGLDLTDKQIDNTFKRMIKKKPVAISWLEKSFLSNEMKNAYKELLESRFTQLKMIS
ncbi:MAG: type II toxin-antitoxin system HipA family toxin, partial [Bacteroidales bacterium]